MNNHTCWCWQSIEKGYILGLHTVLHVAKVTLAYEFEHMRNAIIIIVCGPFYYLSTWTSGCPRAGSLRRVLYIQNGM